MSTEVEGIAGGLEGTGNDSPNIHKVSVKVGPFWHDRPALWFATLEAQFNLNGITREQTKFYYTISFLDTRVADEVSDLITHPPPEYEYTKLKEALIARFTESYEEKARRLLEKEEIGDRKPSSFLRHLRDLAGPAFPERMLRSIWCNRLPPQSQAILLAQKQDSLQDLGELADRLQGIVNNASNCHLITKCQCDSYQKIETLQGQINELTRVVASLTTESRGRSLQKHAARYRSRSHSQHRGFCYYHNRFGKKALKCSQPCNWKQQPAQSGNAPSTQ